MHHDGSSAAHTPALREPSRTQLNTASNDWGFERFFTGAVGKGYLYNLPVTDGVCGSRIWRDGRQYINFSGINFLGLQEREDFVEHFCDSAREHGLVTGGSRATQGVSRVHLHLEQKMCALQHTPHTLSFGTGLLANIGFVSGMTARFQFDRGCHIDNRDAVFVLDRDSHWSLWKACGHLRFGEQLFSFRHNDPQDLATVLKRRTGKKWSLCSKASIRRTAVSLRSTTSLTSVRNTARSVTVTMPTVS